MQNSGNNNTNNAGGNRRVRKEPSKRMKALQDALAGARGRSKVDMFLRILKRCWTLQKPLYSANNP